MAHIQIGALHNLDIPIEAHDNSIEWVNQRSRKFFTTLKDLDSKKILVKALSRTDLNKCIVSLVDLPQDTFYILRSYLKVIPPDDLIPCICTLNNLVNRGCQCGAFKKESSKN